MGSVDECFTAARAGDLEFLQSNAHWFDAHQLEHISLCAARGGHLEVLQWSSLLGAAPSRQTCEEAAAGGHLIVLQWAREQGSYWDERTCAAAAHNGHLAVLRWARRNSCAWSSSTCEAAAREGHLAVLQFAYQNGCEWGPNVCSAAAEHGNLSILKWLRQHGCPWDGCTSRRAAINNHLELLRWARDQQPPCPWYSRLEYFEFELFRLDIAPGVLVFLWQQQAPLSARHLAQARAAATEMTYAVLSLRAALPDRMPHELVLTIVSLAFS